MSPFHLVPGVGRGAVMDKNRSNAYNFRKQHETRCDEVTEHLQPGKGLSSDVGVLLTPNIVRIVPEVASSALSGRSLIPPVNEAQKREPFLQKKESNICVSIKWRLPW